MSSDSFAVIRLANEQIEVLVAPERGGEIRFIGQPGGDNVLAYNDFLAPLSALTSISYGSSQLDWLSAYRGGWQGLFPNSGPECTVLGVPLPFHGELSTARFEVLGQGPRSIRMRAPARLPMILERRIEIDAEGPAFKLEEEITNESPLDLPFLWGHHPAFRARPGTCIDIPASRVVVDSAWIPGLGDLLPGGESAWPMAPGRDGTMIQIDSVGDEALERLCYLPDLPEAWVALRHAASKTGVAIAWDKVVFPHVWLWTQIGGTDFPWFGRSRIVGIEPHSAWPQTGLAQAASEGRAGRLPRGGVISTSLTVALFDASTRRVRRVNQEGYVELEP